MDRLAAALFAVVVAGQAPGVAAAPEEQATYTGQKPPNSDLFRVPEPKAGVKPPQGVRVEPSEIQVAVRTFTPRIVCGMKMIEGTADLDPGIVKPIPERHGAKIRVLGPPPCADADSRRVTFSSSGSVVLAPIVPDRR
jgi:hypothetical protein